MKKEIHVYDYLGKGVFHDLVCFHGDPSCRTPEPGPRAWTVRVFADSSDMFWDVGAFRLYRTETDGFLFVLEGYVPGCRAWVCLGIFDGFYDVCKFLRDLFAFSGARAVVTFQASPEEESASRGAGS